MNLKNPVIHQGYKKTREYPNTYSDFTGCPSGELLRQFMFLLYWVFFVDKKRF